MSETAQERLAHACRTTLVTDVRVPNAHLARLIDHVSRMAAGDGHFDQLTVPDLSVLVTPAGKDLLGQLVDEMVLLFDLHQGEQVVVATTQDPTPLVEAYRRTLEAALPTSIISKNPKPSVWGLHVPATPSPMPETVAVVCADYRLHADDLGRKLRDAFGLTSAPALYAMAGAAKDIESTTRRSRLALEELDRWRSISDVKRIILTMHTDCGACGGDGRYESKEHQLAFLNYRLRCARDTVRKRFPFAEILTGVVHLKDDKIEKITPVTLA